MNQDDGPELIMMMHPSFLVIILPTAIIENYTH